MVVPAAESNPLKSPLRYPGGKTRVAKLLLAYAPEHKEYREVFAGGAALFFHKAKCEKNWINDRHPGLYAFYVALRDHFPAFAKLCRKQAGDLRTIFNYWADRRDLMDASDGDYIVERAVQFFFINRTVWTGRVVYDPQRRSRLYFSNPEGWGRLEEKLGKLELIAQKLQGVTISNDSFEQCLSHLSNNALVYCDPPYIRDTYCSATDKLYDKSFNEEHHRLLARLLEETPARVMISYDDCPQARDLYSGPKWRFVELQWKYCGRHAVTDDARRNGVKERKVSGRELLILNYDPPKVR